MVELNKWLTLIISLLHIVRGNELSDDEVENFRKEALQQHNRLRARHGVPMLSFNDDLNEMAQFLAFEYSKMPIKKKLTFNGMPLGSSKVKYNLKPTYSGREFSDCLYSFGDNYDYKSGSFETASSFTQLIWRTTLEFGVGVVKSRNMFYVFALYFPAGNKASDVIVNVLPPIYGKSRIPLATMVNISPIENKKQLNIMNKPLSDTIVDTQINIETIVINANGSLSSEEIVNQVREKFQKSSKIKTTTVVNIIYQEEPERLYLNSESTGEKEIVEYDAITTGLESDENNKIMKNKQRNDIEIVYDKDYT